MAVDQKLKNSLKWYDEKTLVLTVEDAERTKAFFEKLGLKFAQEKHGNGPAHYASISRAGVLEIYPAAVNKQVEANKAIKENKERFDAATKTKTWNVPKGLNRQFLFDIASGLTFCVRKYGASREEILAEIKRIAPHINVEVLRE